MRLPTGQKGVALLLFMLAVVGMVMVIFSSVLSSKVQQQTNQQFKENNKTLESTKDVLLSYAFNFGSTGIDPDTLDFELGELPCPDVSLLVNQEGSSDPNCGSTGVNTLGHFPYKSFSLGKIEDSSGECLWYAVSGDYKDSPEPDMLNWDSIGYLNLVNDKGNLVHTDDPSGFPVALLISPGTALHGQDHSPADELPECHANDTLGNYLEENGLYDYSTDLDDSADTLWTFVSSVFSSGLQEVAVNDVIKPIYPGDWWNKIKKTGLFDTNSNAGQTASSSIEVLTEELATCLVTLGNSDTLRVLPYPAQLALTDYRLNDDYDDLTGLRYGRFPQVVDDSYVTPYSTFVYEGTGANTCGLTTAQEEVWKNWKDHFFLIVSEDFTADTGILANNTKCNDGVGASVRCITVDGKPDKIAAMVLYAGERISAQNRVWYWDEATSTVSRDDKQDVSNYLEGLNATSYSNGTQDYASFDGTGLNPASDNDYSWCVVYDDATFQLSAVKCADI